MSLHSVITFVYSSYNFRFNGCDNECLFILVLSVLQLLQAPTGAYLMRCSLYLADMYTLQYFNESAAEWRGAGCSSTSREVVARRMRASAEQCGHCVRFRIRETTLPLIP